MARPSAFDDDSSQQTLGRDSGTESEEQASRSQKRQVSWSFAVVLTAVWSITFVLAIVALTKIFFHDATLILTGINAFTRYIYLPAYVCLAIALWWRRWALAAASCAVVACHVAWMIPDFVRDRRFDIAAAQSETGAPLARSVRVYFFNVLAGNTDYQSLLDEIKNANPDIIVLVEMTSFWQKALSDSPVMAPYVYGSGKLSAHPGGVNVYSKLPLRSDTQRWIAERVVQSVDLDLGSETLRIIGLHSPRPMEPEKYDYRGFWREALPLILATDGPLLVVGDFNATEHSVVYKQLTADHLRSAHDDRGRGYATTWPNGTVWLPPIRIDQALISPEIECDAIAEGIAKGSDHKPLIVDIRLRAPGSRPKTN